MYADMPLVCVVPSPSRPHMMATLAGAGVKRTSKVSQTPHRDLLLPPGCLHPVRNSVLPDEVIST